MDHRPICRFGKQCHGTACKAQHPKVRTKDYLPPKNHERRDKRAAHKQKKIDAKRKQPPERKQLKMAEETKPVLFKSPLIVHPDFVYEVIAFMAPVSLSAAALAILTNELIDMDALRIITRDHIFYRCLFYEANMPLYDVILLSDTLQSKLRLDSVIGP